LNFRRELIENNAQLLVVIIFFGDALGGDDSGNYFFRNFAAFAGACTRYKNTFSSV